MMLAACGGAADPVAPVDNSVARVVITPATAASLVAGTTTTLSATAFTKDNRALSVALVWSSSNEATASVSNGVVTARLVGTATITAASGGVTATGVSFTVTAGAPAQLAVRTQPDGAAAGIPLTSQPVVEVRDSVGNAVTTATTTVSVALASGGGTLGGTASAVATNGVATFTGLSVAGTVGARTLSFTASGLTPVTSAPFTLAAGAPSQLVMRTQPVAGAAYATFVTPPVVEIRDASGNLTAAAIPVLVAIASGGGSIAAGGVAQSVAGVATFSGLIIAGTAGPRTLTFSSGGPSPVTSAVFNVAAAPPAVIALAPTTLSLTAMLGQTLPVSNVAVTNTGVFPLTNVQIQGITYPSGTPGWLSASVVGSPDAPTTIRLIVTSASLALGTYSATVVVSGDGAAATTSLSVSLTVVPLTVNVYGTAANKVSIVAGGSSISPGLVTTSAAGAVVATDPTIAFVSRSPAIATVDNTGRITAVAPGQAWIAATSTATNSDSVLVIVPRTTGPILRTDATTYAYHVGDTITTHIQLDMRGAAVGAVTATVSWPLWVGATGQYGTMTLLDVNTSASALGMVSSADTTVNVIRLNGTSAAGVSGVVQLATVRFVVRQAGATGIYLNASELLAPDFTNLLPLATFAQYPVIAP